VVFGKADGAKVELSDIELGTSEGGFVINGVAEFDQSGFSVSSAGDVNGDGLDDLIVGAQSDDPNGNSNSGASFVVFGKANGAAVELSTVEAGSGGFVINGANAFDASGASVSSAGDVNGDGFDDLIIGAQSDDPNGSNSGASFVVFGGDFTGAATQVGTTGADTLTGTAGNDVLIAGTGDDTLIGSGGADVLRGGAGNDILAVSTSDFTKIEGGSGTDTLRLDGTGLSLDFRTIADSAITEIEIIDLNGQGNLVSLDVLEVLRLSDSSNTVRILGDNTDGVTLYGASWNTEAAFTDSFGTFVPYSDGNAEVYIPFDINPEFPDVLIDFIA
jgi:Ca2+-binding RTX toxin-like protein